MKPSGDMQGALEKEGAIPIGETDNAEDNLLAKEWTNMKVSNQSNGPDERDSDGDEYLIEDSYSVIYVTRVKSIAFLYASITIFIQMAITSALLWDVFIGASEDGNPIGVPPDVPPSVRMVAFLTLMLAPGFMEDFLTAVSFLSQGYDRDILSQKPHATFSKYILAGVLQLLTGLGLLTTIFALIMQSETVLGLMLNYAALHFVSQIDNMAFRIAKDGYITKGVQQEMCEVNEVRVPAPGPLAQMARRVAYVVACLLLLFGYILISLKQDSGKYLCQKLSLQLGDGFNHVAAAFSGVYVQAGKTSGLNSRVIYSAPKDYARLGYCIDDATWTLVASGAVSTTFDPCSNDWIVKSTPSEGYDILEVADSTWYVSVDGRRVEAIDHFIMKCIDCDLNPIAGRSCSGSGVCMDNTCICDEGYAGLQCEFTDACEDLVVDFRRLYFPDSVNVNREGGSSFETYWGVFNLLRRNDSDAAPLELYNKPVYLENSDTEETASLLLFLGRRWVVTGEYRREDLERIVEDFHGIVNPPNISFVSEAVDQGTPMDSLSPVGLAWFQPEGNTIEGLLGRPDISQPIQTQFLCAVCDGSASDFQLASNPCFRGECTEESFCFCGNNITVPSFGSLYMGSLCEETADYNAYYVVYSDSNVTNIRLEVESKLFGIVQFFEYDPEFDTWFAWYPDFDGDIYEDPEILIDISFH